MKNSKNQTQVRLHKEKKSKDSTNTTRAHMREKGQADESSGDDVQIVEEKSSKQKGKGKLSDVK